VINFRFHVVSLTAVFLAIALGVAIGVTVIDKKVVDVNQARINKLSSQLSDARAAKSKAQGQLSDWNNFFGAVGNSFFGGRLNGANVLVVSEAGMSSGSLKSVDDALHSAGAREVGALSFTDKWSKNSSTADLAKIIGVSSRNPAEVRKLVMERLVANWQDPKQASILSQLVSNGYINWSTRDDSAANPVNFTLGPAQVLAVGSNSSSLSKDDAFMPFTEAFAAVLGGRMIIASTSDDQASDNKSKPILIDAIRKDSKLDGKATTVDNVETFPGRTALILGFADLVAGHVGDYGVNGSASKTIPGT
jgi:hypothetical protein